MNEKSLEMNRKLRNQDCVISTATTTNDCERLCNFRKILFYNECFLFHAKPINSLIKLHVVSYDVQIGLLPIMLSLTLNSMMSRNSRTHLKNILKFKSEIWFKGLYLQLHCLLAGCVSWRANERYGPCLSSPNVVVAAI